MIRWWGAGICFTQNVVLHRFPVHQLKLIKNLRVPDVDYRLRMEAERSLLLRT